VSFTVERPAKQRRARRLDAAVGVDVGIARLASLSTGEAFANARPLRDALRKLRRLQRQLDRQRRANNPGNYLPDGRARTGASR
jgi:putative transposase